ncbi:MAG: type I DNA topoisomerase [Gammaproteobacteria bacterium]|nr:type I DNA topoisomerase [Gammaproteobacteria bacterium]
MKLLIVESPSKTHTIKQYLGSEYDVVASKGHVRDIANTGKDNLGLDFENNLKPIYSIIENQDRTIKELNSHVKKCDTIYLATDPDREGEAISWHLKETLNLENKVVKRIEFNEITKSAVLNAIDNPRDIDMDLVSSQETRKIIDRIIGYKLSNLIKRETGSLSAGRVQSVALKLVCDREVEIQNFNPEGYFEIEAITKPFKAKMVETGKNTVLRIDNEEEAKDIYSKLSKKMLVKDIIKVTKYEKAQAPFSTSDLYQAANTRYSMSSQRTAKCAQSLYEGVKINDKPTALITYMRTDTKVLSNEFVYRQLIPFIKNNFGEEYLGYLHKGKEATFAQGAHEAIRPVSLSITPSSVKEFLTPDQYKIYGLIYERTVQSIMKDSIIEETQVTFDSNGYEFKAYFPKYTFKGFQEGLSKLRTQESSFDGAIGDTISFDKINLDKKETEGPQRYSEASLIKEMETRGIGRPSTYASTIYTLKNRKYITSTSGSKKFTPTPQGLVTSKFLDSYFSEFINVTYTADMEHELDEIAKGEEKEEFVVKEFYDEFSDNYSKVITQIKPVETGETCPICGSKMVYRKSNFGIFEACSNYPTCKYIKKEEQKESKIPTIECPECHKGHLVEKKYRGRTFYGCSEYPSCKFTTNTLKIKVNKK